MTHSVPLRLVLSALLASLPALSGIASAQGTGPDVTFELRPHCDETSHAAADDFGGDVPPIDGVMDLAAQTSTLPCPEYAVRDPLSRQTDVLKAGDTLDMDLILHNPSGLPLQRFRAWIAYDSNVLEGTNLDLSDAFPVATPGEADFSIADNYVKLSGTSEQPVSDKEIVLARITLKVKSTPTVGTVLSFYDPSGTASAHTGTYIGDGVQETNVASTVQGSLAIRFDDAPSSAASSAPAGTTSSAMSVAVSSAPTQTSSVPASSTASVQSSSASSAASIAEGIFSTLQVQALRVTTEGSSVFLAWNPLPSSQLVGYNLYYGSISGRYLQRRSVDGETQTLTIRALPVGQTYYFAVRAVNGSGEESDFSQEVAVTVGNPATSTSPLSGNLIEGPQGNAPGTGGNVAGESGPTSWLLLFAAASALAGTALAFRRQWTAVPPFPR